MYLVCPARMASMADSLMTSGVSKSGSPAAKLSTSSPSRRIALALLATATVAEGLRAATRWETVSPVMGRAYRAGAWSS